MSRGRDDNVLTTPMPFWDDGNRDIYGIVDTAFFL
jgi:hypothetical protein